MQIIMKAIRHIFGIFLIVLLAGGCEQELDPITSVKPGADTEDPAVEITFPIAGKTIRISPDITKITFVATVTDDIEIGSVKFYLDDTEIGNVESFKDYRRSIVNMDYEGLPDGEYVLKVVATDLTGKSDETSRTFRKTTAVPYTPLEGEVHYFPFEGDLVDALTGTSGTKVGSPGFAAGRLGDAYKGAKDAYFTYPADKLKASDEFSVAFWIKVNPNPTRAGLISISPPGENRNSGIRIFREGTATEQKIGLNYGIGETEVWVNPFYTFAPGDWIHVAITISESHTVTYINGEVAVENIPETPSPLSWAETSSTMSIASGEPDFGYWEHFSELSLIDEMHFFDRVITPEEVQGLYNIDK
jgi:hypothetical protein